MTEFYYESVGKDGNIVSVVLSGKLDDVSCDYLLGCVENQIENGHTKLILDCDDLTFISSMGLGMLIRVHSRMRKNGGDVKLAAVHGAVANVIAIVKLDRVLQIFPTVEDAIKAHGG